MWAELLRSIQQSVRNDSRHLAVMCCRSGGMVRALLIPQRLVTAERKANTRVGIERAERAMAKRQASQVFSERPLLPALTNEALTPRPCPRPNRRRNRLERPALRDHLPEYRFRA